MKNVSQILTYVLLVAVAVLFYLQFSGKGGSKTPSTYDAQAIDSLSTHLKVAYVNYDTIYSQYKLVKDLNEELNERRSTLNAKFDSETRRLENDIRKQGEAFQVKVQDYESKAKEMSEFQMKKKVIELKEEEAKVANAQYNAEAELTELQEKYSQEVAQLQMDNSAKVQTAIADYINRYNHEHNFTLIFAHAAGGGILHADARMNITKDILEGLNAEYDEAKAKEEKKK